MNHLAKPALFGFAIILLLLLGSGWKLLQSAPHRAAFIAHRVAHAGGGIQGQTYTNSYEALDLNRHYGFQYFEIDFSFTSDNHLVCLHDWDGGFNNLFGFKVSGPLSYKEFLRQANTLKHEPCTLEGLAVWMRANPDAKIVTDLKERNIDGLGLILQVLPDATSRVIPQIYSPHEYSQANSMGFAQVIWTLYRYNGDVEQILKWVDSFDGPLAVTMPKQTAMTTLPSQLEQRGIPTYVHTVNDGREAQRFREAFQLTEIYTDFLRP